LLPTGTGVQTLTPVKTPTHNIRMVGPVIYGCYNRRLRGALSAQRTLRGALCTSAPTIGAHSTSLSCFSIFCPHSVFWCFYQTNVDHLWPGSRESDASQWLRTGPGRRQHRPPSRVERLCACLLSFFPVVFCPWCRRMPAGARDHVSLLSGRGARRRAPPRSVVLRVHGRNTIVHGGCGHPPLARYRSRRGFPVELLGGRADPQSWHGLRESTRAHQ